MWDGLDEYSIFKKIYLLMVIGLFDVEVGQIQWASWDVFSSFTLLNLAETFGVTNSSNFK